MYKHDYSPIDANKISIIISPDKGSDFIQLPEISHDDVEDNIELTNVDKLKLYDSSIYSGEVAKETMLPHGKGTATYTDESNYQGQWKEGKPHGYGVREYPNGDVY